MEKVTEHLNEFKSKIPNSVEELQDYLDYLKEKIPTSYDDFKPQIEYVKSIKGEDVVNDFKNLKVSPITVSLTLVAFTTLYLFGKLIGGGRAEETPKKKPRKKLTKAQKANRQIQEILD